MIQLNNTALFASKSMKEGSGNLSSKVYAESMPHSTFIAGILAVLSIFIFPPDYLHAEDVQQFSPAVYLEEVIKGEPYVGGRAPKIISINTVKEIDKKVEGKTYYQFKVVFERASRDIGDSTFPILEARSWADFFSYDPSKRKIARNYWGSEKINRLLKSRFPTLKCKVNYTIRYGEPSIRGRKRNQGLRRRHGEKQHEKRRIVEYLSDGFLPGRHTVELHSKLGLAPHPLKLLYNVYEWVDLARNPLQLVSEYLDPKELVKKVATEAVKSVSLETKSTYKLEVLAKVPPLIGLHKKQAHGAILRRQLRTKIVWVNTSNSEEDGIVKDQMPAQGSWLKNGEAVQLTINVYNRRIVGKGKFVPSPAPK